MVSFERPAVFPPAVEAAGAPANAAGQLIIFLSTVSDEFRGYRAQLRDDLMRAAEVGAVIGTPGPDLRWAGTPITMVTHNAHSPGHTALWVPAARVLIAGDMLSDVELPLLEESSLTNYLEALDALRPFVNQAEVIIPGHGTPATGPQGAARWAADHRYLEAVAAGADPVDPRRDLPGMEHAHRANLERLAAVT